jgi:hypothetical protein
VFLSDCRLAMVSLYFMYYDFARIHRVGLTPAMEQVWRITSGVFRKLWHSFLTDARYHNA